MVFQNPVTGHRGSRVTLAGNVRRHPGRRPASQLLQSADLRIRITSVAWHAWRRPPSLAAPDQQRPRPTPRSRNDV